MGEPAAHGAASGAEPMGVRRRTRGTETSQYPEERTSTETPLVAASGRGPGQRPRRADRKRLESRPRAGDRPVRATGGDGPRVGRDT